MKLDDDSPEVRMPPEARARPAGAGSNERLRGRATAGIREQDAALAARKFLGRLAQLGLDDLGATVRRWHGLVGTRWFDAEAALTQAMHETDRYAQQESWLGELAAIFQRRPWFSRSMPGIDIGASDASSQYVATIAMLALLVRDQMSAADFALLYEPFAAVIPIEALERE